MTTPSSPNFTLNTGARLATDRFDFEKHINGTDFHHHADQISLSPSIVIGAQTVTQIQDAIASLNALITSSVADATTSSKGVIQLAGDIAGTATNIGVVGIQGRPISTLPPSSGNALVWNGSAWAPTTVNSFMASGDLSGNNISQSVVGLSGNGGIVNISADLLEFANNSVFPFITQSNSNTGFGGFDFRITAQSSVVANTNGGNFIASGGDPGTGGLKGGVKLQIGAISNADNMVQLTSLSGTPTGRRILSLVNSADLSTTDMPDDTGDMVIHIHDAVESPDTGTPSNGVIVYSTKNTHLISELHIKQSDGNDFVVGSSPNPSIWGPDGYQIITTRSNPNFGSFVISSPNFAESVTSFLVLDESTVKVDVIAVGKESIAGAGEAAQFNLSIGFVRSGGGAPVAIGTLTNTDPRTTAGASGWTLPTISILGNFIVVRTGFSTTSFINWTFITRFIVVSG